MKGTSYNGSHFANKGTSRSSGEEMFSVGGVVAFRYDHYCSPDGRSHSSGCCPSTKNYLLQEEILLEEYNNTESDRYGSGDYDVKKIVELPDVFWHEYSTQLVWKTFLLGVLDINKNVFLNECLSGDITEVRNHPGKFLHIYEIPEGYRGCKKETFTETVDAINQQKKQEDNRQNQLISDNFRGHELIFGITASGWYASRASFGKYSVQLAHEYDSTRRNHYKIVIMPCVPNGDYSFYVQGIPMSLHLREGQEPSIDTFTQTHWANSQSWKYCEIQTLSIEKGWIFVEGEDVFCNTKKRIEDREAERKSARSSKFQELSKAVAEKHGEEVLKLALRKKGSVLSILKTLSESSAQVEFADFKKVLELSNSAPVIANLIVCIAGKVDVYKATKVAEKAYAWAYLHSALPGIGFTGHFDDASKALEIYSKNWEIVPENKEATNRLGDFFPQ